MIFIDLIEVLMVIINFIILVLLMKGLIYKPVTELLDKRIEKINKDLGKAEKNRIEAEKLHEDVKNELAQARKESLIIKENAILDSQKRAKEISNDAEKERERIITQTKLDIDLEYDNAKNLLKNEIAEIAIKLTGKLINSNIDKAKNKSIIKQYTS